MSCFFSASLGPEGHSEKSVEFTLFGEERATGAEHLGCLRGVTEGEEGAAEPDECARMFVWGKAEGQGTIVVVSCLVVTARGREAPAAGLGVGAKREGAAVLGVELLLHELGPEQAAGALLSDLHEGVHPGVPEEGQAGRELVDGHAGGDAGADIFDPVGQGVGQLQVKRRPGFLDVIAGDRDRVELRHLARSV
ncbi:hypothetical protein GALL_491730 [mine drainage metagenome]|uniref:Uncharacterized protein n=1 Tax=mine drainage metagenome TaxID=410659 RepID=A0A1J5Q030_9ZZZZ